MVGPPGEHGATPETADKAGLLRGGCVGDPVGDYVADVLDGVGVLAMRIEYLERQ